MHASHITPTLSPQWLQRFGGIARLYGDSGLEALARANFLVIGIGGVGTWIAEALARSGVGAITLVDLDDICITNTNRQIHALANTVGHSKTRVMAERLRAINPELDVREVEDFVALDNLAEIILPNYDVVIDAADNFRVKAALIAHCRGQKQQVITVGSAGGKRDPRQIVSGDLSRTLQDPLLSRVRKQLRQKHAFPRNQKRVFSVEAIYSPEQMLYPDGAGGVCQAKDGVLQDGVKLDCAGGFGAATMVTASFGMIAAARGVERLLERNQTTES